MSERMIINKPIEDMTESELRRELDIHIWLASVIGKELNKVKQKVSERVAPNIIDDYAQKYINGQITLAEYKRSASLDKSEEYYRNRWQDRLVVAEGLVKHHQGEAEVYKEAIAKLAYDDKVRRDKEAEKRRKPKKKRKLPKTYGYDPRKNASQNNYVRDDWGHTRENVELHRAYRKQKNVHRRQAETID